MRIRTSFLAALVASVVAVQVGQAEDGKKAKKSEEVVELKSSLSKDKIESCIGACRVNFRKEFGVPLEYLDSIGQQIHDARKSPDPVALGLAAKSLAVAEEVSGKKASVTSKGVMEEAVLLAKLRGVSTELAALSKVVSDKATQKDLAAQAAAAAKQEAEAREATKKGDAGKELHGTLQVINHSHECLRIYVDGRYYGLVHEGRTRNFHVHAHAHHNHFDAYCEEGHLIRSAHATGHHHFLRWHIGH